MSEAPNASTEVAKPAAGPLVPPRPELLPRLEAMGDPLNRYYRYPAARALLPLFVNTSVTPNQVTFFHMGLGVVAAACLAQGSTPGLYAAFALSEIRLVLDCFDGVLARAKGVSSPWGRTLDELADSVSYICLSAAMYWRIHVATPDFPALPLLLAMMATGGLMAWSTDFYKRKLTSALKSGKDGVYDELLPKWKRFHDPRSNGFLTLFGFWFDWMQVVVLQPSVREGFRAHLEAEDPTPPATSTPEIAYLVERGESREVMSCMRAISLMSGDNVIGVMNLGLLTGSLVATQLAVVGYGLVTMLVGVYLCNALFADARREGRRALPRDLQSDPRDLGSASIPAPPT